MELPLTSPPPRGSRDLPSNDSTVFNYTTDNNTSPSDHTVDDYIEKQIADKIHLIYVPLCVSVGILGNSFTFCVLVMTSLRKTTTCLYMAVIACMDSLILVIDFVIFFDRMTEFNVYNTWACGLLSFIFYASIHYDVLLLVSMTVERYVAVRFPLKAASLITTKKAIIVIVSLAVFSAAVNSHNLFTRTVVLDPVSGQMICRWEGGMDELFLTKIYPWIDAALYCFIPMASLFVFNILIIWNLKKSSKSQRVMTQPVSVSTGSRSSGLDTQVQGQRQVTVMLMLVSFAFLFLATPVAVLIIVQRYIWFPQTAQEVAVYSLVKAIIDNLMFTNHTINFLLYCISGKRFRTEVKRLCCKRLQQTKARAYTVQSVALSISNRHKVSDISVTN